MKFLKVLIFALCLSFSLLSFAEGHTRYVPIQNYDTPTLTFHYFGIRHNMKLARADCEDAAQTFLPKAKCGKLKHIFYEAPSTYFITFELVVAE